MNRRDFLQHFLGVAAGSYLATTPMLARAQRHDHSPLIMGVFPRRNTKITYRMFWPMAAYLSAELGREVRLVTEKNFETFWANVQNRKYDLVHFNQYHYVVAHEHYGYNAILMNEEQGSSTICGSLIVRNDSSIETISDLEGKNIIFGGGPRAMQSYIIPRWLLEQAGLSEDSYTTEFARNPPNAIFSTYNKQANAAGSGDAVMEMNVVQNRINISDLKFLAKSQPMTHLPWAVSDKLAAELSDKIQGALSALSIDSFGRHVLKRAELTGLRTAIDEDYDQARLIIRDVYGKDFGVSKLK